MTRVQIFIISKRKYADKVVVLIYHNDGWIENWKLFLRETPTAKIILKIEQIPRNFPRSMTQSTISKTIVIVRCN